jgi:hypothetical protein
MVINCSFNKNFPDLAFLQTLSLSRYDANNGNKFLAEALAFDRFMGYCNFSGDQYTMDFFLFGYYLSLVA